MLVLCYKSNEVIQSIYLLISRMNSYKAKSLVIIKN